MAEPKVFDRKPQVVELNPGTYAWCSCGESKNQPFCDGSHKGSGLAPVRFEMEEKSAWPCAFVNTLRMRLSATVRTRNSDLIRSDRIS